MVGESYVLASSRLKCHRKVASGKKDVCAIRCLVNDMTLQLERASVLDEGLLVLVQLYGSETMI